MKLSRKWLNEFVPVTCDDKEFSEAMTLSGSKVEVTEIEGGEIQNVVVGRVLSMVPHPNSDHMFICQVDVGAGVPVQIVTGAQNVHEGDLVPVAKDDSYLPGGIHITGGKLRGEESDGMLCSYKELGMTDHDWPNSIVDGIFILESDPELKAKDLRPGDDLPAALGLDDHVVEFEITPNRPDCLAVIGLAREAAATFHKPISLHEPVVKGTDGTNVAELLDVEIEDPELCPRYTARMVKNVKVGPSPLWMRERLRANGIRPISNIVDITNYVMLEYGQPMHAFDFSCVKGGRIVVRTAREGEVIQTLDGNDRKLTPSMLCICDEDKPVGVAGVMGGANSEIVGDTAMVVFESANFNGISIRRTATSLGMRTDASGRYEKGLDPMNTYKGVQRACELVELLGCGQVVDGVIDVIAADSAPRILKLEPDKINALLGTDVSRDEMVAILKELDFEVNGDDVTVPSWRGDVEGMADLAEEVARFHGYNNIPITLMQGATTRGGRNPHQKAAAQAEALCRGMGLSEIVTYSFISPSYYDKIRMDAADPRRSSITILNPLGEDTSIMRTTAIPSMLETLARNLSFRNKAAALYELGTVYLPKNDGSGMADERPTLSLGLYGDGADFFALKGMVEDLMVNMGVKDAVYAACATDSAFHPGRCAQVSAGGRVIGVFGQIHPLTAENYGMDCPVFAAELDFDELLAARAPEALYQALPRFPSVTRDIAVVCDDAVTVGALEDCIRRGAKGLIKDVALFDVYTGAPIPTGKKSVAFSLVLRADDRTLTDAEADEDVSNVLTLLKSELAAVLR